MKKAIAGIAVAVALFQIANGSQAVVLTAQQVAAGGSHTCALMSDSTVECWGLGGTLGNGDRSRTTQATPVTVLDASSASDPPSITPLKAIALAAGSIHTCAIVDDGMHQGTGTVQCWGYNYSGQLGNGTQSSSLADDTGLVPVSVITWPSFGLLDSVKSISASADSTCAVRADGSIWCWGSGSDEGSGWASAVQYTGLSGSATAIAVGQNHRCALLVGGTIECWGNDYYDQLGDKPGTDNLTNVGTNWTSFTSPTGIVSTGVSLSAGEAHTCAIVKILGAIECWGWDAYFQIGNFCSGASCPTGSRAPSILSSIFLATQVSAGSYHTCALVGIGTIFCWGSNDRGQLGIASASMYGFVPSEVPGLTDIVSISSGAEHACALRADGTVWCWGDNSMRQLGSDLFDNEGNELPEEDQYSSYPRYVPSIGLLNL